MAQARRLVCSVCGRAITAWSDGNPYYIDEAGVKRYAYHPDPKRRLCIGNDSPHLCLGCGAEFAVDSRAPVSTCSACGSAEITPTYELAGRPCPHCRAGVFHADPEFFAVS